MPRIGRGPLLMFVAAAFVLADVVILWIGLRADFAFDFTCCYQQAGHRVLDDPATLYSWSDTYTFRYTPLGALVFAPLARLSVDAATLVFLLVKIGALALAAAWFSRAWEGSERLWVVLAVVAFPPIVHDMVIGNVTTFTLLVLVALLRWPGLRGGAALGALLILAPKPHLLPVLAWLAIRRPRAFAGAVAAMAGGLGVGLIIFGADPWLEFLGTLREPLERTFTANIGFSGLLGPAGVVLGVAAAAVIWAAGVLRGGQAGFGLAILSGIVLGPYTFIHYIAGAFVAVEGVLRTRPRALVAYPWLLIAFPLIPVWLLALAWTVWRHGGVEERPAAAPG